MRPSRPAKYLGFLAVLELTAAGPARADRSCSPIAVEADPAVRWRWPGLAERVSEALAERDDLDTCAEVSLGMTEGSIAVWVQLPDGRSTARTVARREDVLPVVEALLLVPQRMASVAAFEPLSEPPAVAPEARPDPPRAPTAASFRAPEPAAEPLVSDRNRSSASPVGSSDGLRVELSVAAGARYGDGQTSTGLAALSFLDAGGWLAGFEGRLDAYRKIDDGSKAAALELAALGGRRLRLGTSSLDFFAGPALVYQGTATSVTEGTPEGERVSESSSSAVLRVLGGARVNFSARSTLRSFIAVDGEVGPDRAAGAELPRDAPRLPFWTVGLAVGATVGKP